MNPSSKFQAGDRLQHLKTGGFYRVIGLAKIEATLEDVYVYEAVSNNTLWVRPKAEMEDGRFVRVK